MREHWARSPFATPTAAALRWRRAPYDEQADPLFVFSSYANDDADRVAFRIKSLL